MLSSKTLRSSNTLANDSQFAERLSNAFHFTLMLFFALLTSDVALHIAKKLI